MPKIVATTFCKTLENPTTLRLQINRRGQVFIRPYRHRMTRGVKAEVSILFFQHVNSWMHSHGTISIYRDGDIIFGEDDKPPVLQIKTVEIERGKKTVQGFSLKFKSRKAPIHVSRDHFLSELAWLEAKRMAYLKS